MFTWIEMKFGVPPVEVLVDTAASGFAPSSYPDRIRLIDAHAIAEARAELGFSATRGRGEAVRCTGEECTITDGRAILRFDAPAIRRSYATMMVAFSLENVIKASPWTNPELVGQSRISFTLYKLNLRRMGRTWVVASADVVAVN